MKTPELLALLSAADAKVETSLNAHDATWEIYDALPGDVHSHGQTRWKSGAVNGMKWTVFEPRMARAEAPSDEPALPQSYGETKVAGV